MVSGYKFTIPNPERKSHLVVSPQTHLAIKLYAQKNNITITEATQRLLSNALKSELEK